MTIPPPLLIDGDTPRARRSDPISSHIAGDVSQRSIKATKVHVLQLVAEHERIVGTHLNDLYLLAGPRRGWKPVAPDSPRKRAGELAEDGFLEVIDYGIADGNHLPEAIYQLTEKGRAVVNGRRAAA